jgi:hypothetical protein
MSRMLVDAIQLPRRQLPTGAADVKMSSLDVTKSVNGCYRGKERLISRDRLDRRTAAAKQFDSIASGIVADLGGEANLSIVARHLVEAFAGIALHVNNLNAHLLLGKEVDLTEHATAISTMVRLASRIGITRVARDISPTLNDLIRAEDAARTHDNVMASQLLSEADDGN